MSEDVVQWLAEIRALKQELAQCRSELDLAYQSANHWRELYSTEAKQRRIEARLAQETIAELQGELRQVNTTARGRAQINRETTAAIEQELAGIKTSTQLRRKLLEAIQDRDRALSALSTEQENHARTRDNLTAAIGDAIEQVMTLRAAAQPSAASSSPQPTQPSSPGQ
jgi:chromosome segregation ATPase